MSPDALKVAMLGDVNIDVFLNIPTYPCAGGDALADTVELRTGGSVANTAIILSRLGLRTEMITHTGQDAWAEIALATLHTEGVGLNFLRQDARAGTGLIFIPVASDGERTMFSYRGANILLGADEIRPKVFSGVDLLHISGYSFLQAPQKEAAWRAVEMAEARHIPLTLDLGVEPALALGVDLETLLGKLDLLVLGDQEALKIAKKDKLDAALAFLLSCGVKTIGLKLGQEGCLVVTPDSQVRLPGFKVDTIDTTGAGDAFSAAMIYGRLAGLSLAGRGLFANVFGALATTVWGGGAALPSLEAVKNFLQQRKNGSEPWDGWVEEVLASLENV